jgi:hypothetical protein
MVRPSPIGAYERKSAKPAYFAWSGGVWVNFRRNQGRAARRNVAARAGQEQTFKAANSLSGPVNTALQIQASRGIVQILDELRVIRLTALTAVTQQRRRVKGSCNARLRI